MAQNIIRSAIWRLVLALTGVALTAVAAHAQPSQPSVFGRWLSQDKDGVIEISICGDGTACGRLAWFRPSPEDADKPPPVDEHDPDPALRGRPLCGLVILGGFKPKSDRDWVDGWVYDPENGKTYHATMRLARNDTLRLRGYIGIPLFGQTQVWTRAAPEIGACAGLAPPS